MLWVAFLSFPALSCSLLYFADTRYSYFCLAALVATACAYPPSLQTKLLVVTDVAARGIDVPLLNNVINYAFPPAPKLFVHRVGRAARQGRTGTVR